MKALIYFQPGTKYDNYEGTRMRKTIKGALEVVDMQYTSNIYDEYDVAHFLSPDDESKMNIVLERGVPCVVSALFGEDDPSVSFLKYRRDKDGKRVTTLRNRSLRMLNRATLVLVPSESAKRYLIENKVETPIEVCPPGVNLARFNFSRDDEKELFYRYFREDKNKKIVLAVGEYDNLGGIHAFINAALKRDDTVFYYVGHESKAAKSSKVKKIIKEAPKNVRFKFILPDDIYRSLLLNADVFMLPGYNLAGMISVEEAMAAKCQLIVRKSSIFPGTLKNESTAYIAEFSETLTSLVLEYLNGDVQPTIQEAYNQVSANSLNSFGENLINIYKSIINNK